MIRRIPSLSLSIQALFVVLAGFIGPSSAAEDSVALSVSPGTSVGVEEQAELIEELSAIFFLHGMDPNHSRLDKSILLKLALCPADYGSA